MANQFLSSFYTYKIVPEGTLSQAVGVADNALLDEQIRIHMENGHRYFFKDEFQNALSEYQAAYSLLHKAVHPAFPVQAVAADLSLVQHLDLTEYMIAASAQAAKYRATAGVKPLIPGDPPEPLTAVVNRCGGLGPVSNPSPAAVLYDQAYGFLQAGAVSEAEPLIQRALTINAGKDGRLESNLFMAAGAAALQRQKFTEARGHFEQAIRLVGKTRAADAITASAAAAGRQAVTEDVGLLLRILDSLGNSFGGPVDIDIKHRTLKTAPGKQLKRVSAAAEIRIAGLRRAPQSDYVVTVAPSDEFRPQSKFVSIPASGSAQLDFVFSAPETVGSAPARLAAINNNLGVVAALAGDAAGAGAAFQSAADNAPLPFGRTVTQRLNPGTASTIERPMGSVGLPLIMNSPSDPNMFECLSPSITATSGATRYGVFTGEGTIVIDLQHNATEQLKAVILEPRITATSLEKLNTFEAIATNFLLYLPHSYGFTLPLSLGDCYLELGDYETALGWYIKARDYPYLNQAIEAPVVWLKIANTYVRWGNFLFESARKADARSKYETVVRLTAPVLDPASPLYKSPVFDAIAAQVQAILAAPQPLDPAVHNPAIAAVVLLAKLNVQNIEDGIDYPLLSLSQENVPVFRFEYLQNVARYFATHAIETEQTYIQFKSTAEQEAFTLTTLQNAADLEAQNVDLEQKKVDVAEAQQQAITANLDYAKTQLKNAKDMKTDYETVSIEENSLDAEITYVGAPTTEYNFSGYGNYGIPDGKHRCDEALRTLTGLRKEISRGFELRNMDRRISELASAVSVAQAQVNIADKQKIVADQQKAIADLRKAQADLLVKQFKSQEFTPDLWNRLASEIRQISRSYLNQAIVIAKIMEEVYEFEVGRTISIIKPSYTRNDLSGLLAGDFLLRDIDSFTYMRIVLGEKKQPVKEIISLADRFPLQFVYQFQTTGRMDFRTQLSDFDRSYPGAYLQRIKRVEVAVEGLIGQSGIHATLTNVGTCLTRTRNGGIKMRLLEPETLLLSQYRVSADSAVFVPDGEMLSIFEDSPVSTSWVFELSPAANDIILNYITDVKLILYYETFFDGQLKRKVLEELAAEQEPSGRRSVALRYEMFDEFFAFQTTGAVKFTLRPTMLPLYHTNPRVRELAVLVQTDDGVSPANLIVDVKAADGATATQITSADGAISTGSGEALNTFIGRPWLQEWSIAIPAAPNQALFSAGFKWSQVRNIVMVAEYDYVPRQVPGEPHLLLLDHFDVDSLPEFDVCDDPQATVASPSQWALQNARIVQVSGIFGLPPGATATDPSKPGTYLVRKTAAGIPSLCDLIVSVDLQSHTAGGIGVVFRWQDTNNFYYFLMDHAGHFRRIGKKVGGVFNDLATAACDATRGYDLNTSYSLRVRAAGSAFEAYLDGDLVVSGLDTSLPNAGRAGLLCWKCAGAEFDNFRIVEI